MLSPDDVPQQQDVEVDVSFELAGNDAAVELAMALARPGGRVLGGIPSNDRTSFPAALARRKGLTVALVRRMKEDVFEAAVARQGLKVVVQPSG